MNDHLPVVDPPPDRTISVPEAKAKLSALKQSLVERVRDGVLVAFSGGTDSALLLWAATEVAAREGGKVAALTTVSASTPSKDRADAERFGEALAVRHIWEESGEVSDPAYARNDRERCYHCKTELFRIASRVAEEEGLAWLAYGYNATDRGDHRPGHRAALEADVLTPLADAGLGKAEIRYLLEEAGLPLSKKPASPCLSSRIMTGIAITPERLNDVEALETILREGGVTEPRVRVCRDDDGSFFLRVEVPPGQMHLVLEARENLWRAGAERGYRWVTLDLVGYRMGGGVR
jgi:uncharacterized protein